MTIPKPDDRQNKIHLRPAVLGSRHALSTEGLAQLRELMGPRPRRFVMELAGAWLVTIAAVWAAVTIDHWAATVAAIFVVATRQVVLALLLHEQVHHLGLRGRWGDSLVNALAVYPLLATTVEDYSEVHLRHHRHFMSERDPDFVRKAGPEWTFPMRWWQLGAIVLRDALGLNTLRLIKGKKAPAGGTEFRRPHPTPRWLRPSFYLVAIAVITALGAWKLVLLYWVLPVLTLTQIGVRWIAILEHEYGHQGSGVSEVTPLVRLKRWERLFIPDLNFALHVYHHHHPGVSFSKLPEVHALYVREGLVDESAVFEGALSYLRFLCGGPQGSSKPEGLRAPPELTS